MTQKPQLGDRGSTAPLGWFGHDLGIRDVFLSGEAKPRSLQADIGRLSVT